MSKGVLKLYRSYSFKDKDPIIDRIRTVMQDEGLSNQDIADSSGVSATTLHNWFKGETQRPQFATVMAVTRSMGYDLQLVRTTKRASSGITLQKSASAYRPATSH